MAWTSAYNVLSMYHDRHAEDREAIQVIQGHVDAVNARADTLKQELSKTKTEVKKLEKAVSDFQ